jgi:hypothetical protein
LEYWLRKKKLVPTTQLGRPWGPLSEQCFPFLLARHCCCKFTVWVTVQ